jgi:hypothetical protein
MAGNFHETYRHGDIGPPTDRSTGLVFAVVAVIIAALWRRTSSVTVIALCVGAGFAALSILAPRVLRPVTIIWFQIGLLLHRVINPIVMFTLFALVFVPAGLIMRIWYDPLRSRRARPNSTYWIERTASTRNAGSMMNQF